ncbi:alpha/beta hydrolase-fold protein [Siphonobacter sp. SORGH_AS_0500]|uniref:alpha/beta hydrolase n=1 Tax=Siphonobacter sp. SORGH_AS_0500 TaxID=1864824 RepID=UPI002861EF5C|nr:alpha/beta hydrolase-fold protein [Siphonobacter sp. SORGH_AS_0500]MDR6195312.1 putative alpha/beta superfamily hydrolase [Siphonobacter sp. SORGH_AS_0500]
MKFIYYNLLVILVVLTSFSTVSHPNDPIPEHETFKVYSKQIGEERTINVWTPVNYKTNADSFPVMYMADGGIEEDFPHVANTLAKLIQENKIKPLILVGIENTQRRRDLTGFTEVAKDKEIAPVVGGSEKFRSFIKEELFPEINKRYRTTTEKSIIGESLSGLFVVETFFLTPDMFDNYIAFDPSLWWNNHYLVRNTKKYLANFPKAEKRIWFAGSNTEGILEYTEDLAEILKKENSLNVKWNYSPEPKEKHNTIFRATKEKAISWTLNKTE